MFYPVLLLVFFSSSYAQTPRFFCNRPVDIIFVTDESGSITAANWPKVTTFITELVEAFPVGPGEREVQLGYIGFSGALTNNQIPLGSLNKTNFQTKVGNFPFTGGGTATFEALGSAKATFRSPAARPAAVGTSYLTIVITDGDTNGGETGTDRTIAAADALRADGVQVAAVAVGPFFSQGGRGLREMTGIVGGNLRLLFFVEDWNGLDNDQVVLSNLTEIACFAPIAPANLTNVTTPIECAQIIFLTYPAKDILGSPISLLASVSGGNVQVCWSYVDDRPAAATPSPNTLCTVVLPGDTNIATISAFPPGGDASENSLHVSVLALNVTTPDGSSWSCGGRAEISVKFCHARLANPNFPQVPGPGRQNPGVIPSDLGSVGEPTCGNCPSGLSLLASFTDTTAAPNIVGVCSPGCSGGAQYVSTQAAEGVRLPGAAAPPPIPGFSMCRDCPGECSRGPPLGPDGGLGGGCLCPPNNSPRPLPPLLQASSVHGL